MTRLLVLVLIAGLAEPAAAQTTDLDAARVPLDLYLQGHATGDGDFMRQAFHPEATVFWTDDDGLAQRSAPDFANLFTRGPAADEADRHRRIVSLDVTGDVATAKIELDYPRVFITDYMTLVRIDGEWKILNKAYTRSLPRSRS